MAKAIGPGARVYIGYCADHLLGSPGVGRARCSTGTVRDVAPAFEAFFVHRIEPPAWLVDVDGLGVPVIVCERMLTPIDDGDPDADGRALEHPASTNNVRAPDLVSGHCRSLTSEIENRTFAPISEPDHA